MSESERNAADTEPEPAPTPGLEQPDSTNTDGISTDDTGTDDTDIDVSNIDVTDIDVTGTGETVSDVAGIDGISTDGTSSVPPLSVQPVASETEHSGGPESDKGMEAILFSAVLGGLCPLIPIPFLDDLIIGTVRRNMVRAIMKRANLKPTDDQVAMLTHNERGGCLMGCLTFVVIYPLKKIFRKLVYILAVKDCSDVASELFHEGMLLRYALRRGLITTEHLYRYQDPRLKQIRRATVETCKTIDTRPVHQLLRQLFTSSKTLMSEAAGMLSSSIRARRSKPRDGQAVEEALDAIEAAEHQHLEHEVSKLGSELKAHEAYFALLEQTFDRCFEAALAHDAQGTQDPIAMKG